MFNSKKNFKNCCRFCLDPFGFNQIKKRIADDTRDHFLSITSQELRCFNKFSEFTCEQCESKISSFYKFRNDLLNIQEIWCQTFDPVTKNLVKEEKEEIFLEEPSLQLEYNEEDYKLVKQEFASSLEDLQKQELEDVDCSSKSIKQNRPKTIKSDVVGPFICDLCNRSFQKHVGISNHIKTHIQKDPDRSKSMICNQPECEGREFETARELNRHKRDFHCKNSNIFCYLCGKGFTTKIRFEEHFQFNHSSERPFVCEHPDCGKAFAAKNQLRLHRINVHGEKTSAQCKICFKYYKTYESMKKHLKYHEGATFTCDYVDCGKQFITKSKLRIHKKMHLNQKDYVCHYRGCSARYHENSGLRFHIYSVHLKLKIPCEAPGCTSQFSRKEIYKSHVLSMHKDLEESDLNAILLKIREMKLPDIQYTNDEQVTSEVHQEDPLTCKLCKKQFNNKKTLQAHVRLNHRERKFACDFEGCQMKFSVQTVLKKHRNSHLKLKLYQCDECLGRFSAYSNAYVHIVSSHIKYNYNCPVPGCNAIYHRKDYLQSHVRKSHLDLGDEQIDEILDEMRNIKVDLNGFTISKLK